MKVLNFDGTIYEARAGSASQPGISFAGDPNTGIYSPGADQLAISTNGTGRLFVDASGNVGISTAPDVRFALGDFTSNEAIRIRQTANGYGTIYFANGSSGANLYQGFIEYGAGTAGDFMRFGTAQNERLRITSAGLVGIGTSSPTTTLDCRGVISTNDAIYCYNTARDGLGIWYNPGGAGVNQLTARVAGGDRLTIDSSGNVGIGSTPVAPLDVKVATDARLLFQDGNTANNVKLNAVNNAVSANTNLEIASANTLFFNGGSERARIDSSGRLLVGTSSARGNFYNSSSVVTPTFQTEGTNYGTSSAAIVCNSTSTTVFPMFILAKSAGSTVGSNTAVSDGHILGQITFQGNDGTEFVDSANITAVVDGTSGANDLPTRLVFSTTADGASSPTERMRISQNGGTSWRSDGATSTHDLGNSNTSITGEVITVSAYRNTVNDTFKFLTCVRQGFAVALEIRDDGDVYNVNGTYGSLSDAKLKENIVDANSQWDDIKQLRVRNYNFKPETNNSTHKQIGVIAQEIEDVSPGLVNTVPDRDEDGNDLGTVTKSVNYSVLYMKAVKALQEAMERIEQLEADVAALKA